MRGIERSCRGVVGGHFEDDTARAATADLAAERVEEGRSDAGAAPLGHDPKGDYLELFAMAEGEREPHGQGILPGDQTEKTGEDGNLGDLLPAPGIRSESGAMQPRQQGRQGARGRRRQPLDAPGHEPPAPAGRRGSVTSGGRR